MVVVGGGRVQWGNVIGPQRKEDSHSWYIPRYLIICSFNKLFWALGISFCIHCFSHGNTIRKEAHNLRGHSPSCWEALAVGGLMAEGTGGSLSHCMCSQEEQGHRKWGQAKKPQGPLLVFHFLQLDPPSRPYPGGTKSWTHDTMGVILTTTFCLPLSCPVAGRIVTSWSLSL